MPSVMTTASPICASTASMTALLANGGGTKMTLTSAPVSFMASATPPKTGTLAPSKSTVVPALRGFTPPTIAVPEASMRWVCLLPSEPVMPWTMTLLFSLRKIDILVSCRESERRSGGGEFGGPARGAVHRVDHGHQGVVGLGEDPAAFLDVVAVEADDERLGRLVAEVLQGRDDAVRDGVAGRDPTEDVDEHALHGRVGQDDVQAVAHDLRRGAATDVDDPDLALELDVVEVLLLGRRLERVGGGGVLEGRMLGLTEGSVLVQGDLRVQRQHGAVGRLGQRVDLD